MNSVDAKAFLSRVVAWPVNGIGHVNLHYSMTNSRGGKDIVTGKPYQNIDQLIGFCNWAEGTSNIKELWYCTSLQSATATNSKGGLKAVRLKQNAIKLKAIWVDIDVGNTPQHPDKHYDTIELAWKAICKFRDDHKLPQFSAAVKSGGGLHVYWISQTPLDPADWLPYANGLKTLLVQDGIKCDAGLTTDSARILRIPGTLNHKYNPPLPVELMPLPAIDYDFPTVLAALATVAPAVPAAAVAPGFDNSALIGHKSIIPMDPNDTLSDGLREDVLLDPRPIFNKCGFLQDAFFNGGKDYDNPLWNLTLLCATFMENGNGLAHEMSKGHAKYTFAETQTQYERKVAERRDRGLGYPSCATIKGERSAACASCPLFAKGKSPLNIRPERKEITGTVTAPDGRLLAPADAELMLPPGYTVGNDGTIYKVIEREADSKGEAQPDILVKLFYSKLSKPWAQSNPPGINFQTTVDKGNVAQAFIKHEDFSGLGLFTVLSKAQVKYYVDNKRHIEGFFMAWMNTLHDAQAATASHPFGWIGPPGAHTGFSYGGLAFHTDGRETPSGTCDEETQKWYRPVGSLKPWFTAFEHIMSMQRPEHAAIMAMAFAAPLMTVGGEYSSMLSAWSSNTGSQKSSAMKVGLAVWGHPKKTKETQKTTAVSVLLKLGTIRSLPLFWDEISDEAAQKHVMTAMMNSSQGVEGGRGTTKITQQKRGDWQLAMATCANLSFVDHIVKENPTTAAGLARVLEFEVPRVAKTSIGMIDETDASRLLQHLEGNYGLMGLAYAKYLAVNYKRVDEECHQTLKQVGIDLNCSPEERYWKILVGCCIQGAIYANDLGCTFDVPALKAFLYQVLINNRVRMDAEGLEGGSQNNTDNLLTAYLKDRVDQMVWTDTFPTGMGRKRGVSVLRPPTTQSGDVRKAIQVRWDVHDKTLRLSKRDLGKWLRLQNIGVSSLVRGLEELYKCTTDKRVLCAGTAWAVTQEPVLSIPVPAGTSLEDMLNMWSPAPEPTAAAPSPVAA